MVLRVLDIMTLCSQVSPSCCTVLPVPLGSAGQELIDSCGRYLYMGDLGQMDRCVPCCCPNHPGPNFHTVVV